MNIFRLIAREIKYYKFTFLLGLVSVIVAVAVLVAELTLLEAHDLVTKRILAEKEKEMKNEMLRMEDDYRKIMKRNGI